MSGSRERRRLVYILAASHSGSTLLAMLLGGHPDVCTVGELKANSLGDVSRYRCSCGEAILACPFWRAVEAEMARRGLDFRVGRPGTDFSAVTGMARRLLRPLHRGPLLEAARDALLRLQPGFSAHLARTQATNAALVDVVLERTRKRVIVDSSKIGLRLKFLLRNPELDVKVVRLVRDGRAVALTYVNPADFADAERPELRGGGSGASREAERLSMDAAAREWRRSQEEAEAVLSRLPAERWMQLRYEDLCADPAAALRRVFGFAGVDPEVRVGLREAEHHVIGNGMRLDAGREVRLDERWRQALGPDRQAVFARVAGDLNRRLGYA